MAQAGFRPFERDTSLPASSGDSVSLGSCALRSGFPDGPATSVTPASVLPQVWNGGQVLSFSTPDYGMRIRDGKNPRGKSQEMTKKHALLLTPHSEFGNT